MKTWSRDRRKKCLSENNPKIIIHIEEFMSESDGILSFFQNYLAVIQFYTSISNSLKKTNKKTQKKTLSKQEAYDEEKNDTTENCIFR